MAAETNVDPTPTGARNSPGDRAVEAGAEARDWLQHAACAGRDPDLWFHAGSRRRRIAVAICAGCAVARDCCELGREIGASGIWGGRLLKGGGNA